MKKILVSACLLGNNCKYNGENNLVEDIKNDLIDYELIPVCPELLGGLKVPRSPSEIKNGNVINKEGENVSYYFTKGALESLKICQNNQVEVAILKSNSPSCGSDKIYDGNFNGTLIDGDGITAHMLKLNGIKVLNENNYRDYFK